MTTQDDINAFNSNSSTACLLVLAAKTACETGDRVVSVATVADLPDLAQDTVMPGTILFVESIQTMVLAQVGCWTGLDNRELRSDRCLGLVYGWGAGASTGDNTSLQRPAPVLVAGGFLDWCKVSASNLSSTSHSVAIRTVGSAWGWGSNGSGRLGDNTNTDRLSPVSVVGGFCDWCEISAGCSHTVAIRASSTAWSWGANSSGSLGDNTPTPRSSPVSVVGGFCDWCEISAGGRHSLAIRTDGSTWAWGCNVSGQLGDNTVTTRSSPVSVVGGFCDWCAISAGLSHSLGIASGGVVWAWGCNVNRQLGDDTNTARSSPVSVVGGICDWCGISAGCIHSLAIRTVGTTWAWGNNGQGRLGDNSTTSRGSPVSVVGGFSDWCNISAGGGHSLAVRTNGTAWAWGCNNQGQLGTGNVTSESSPVLVLSGFSDWCQISAGFRHSQAIRSF